MSKSWTVEAVKKAKSLATPDWTVKVITRATFRTLRIWVRVNDAGTYRYVWSSGQLYKKDWEAAYKSLKSFLRKRSPNTKGGIGEALKKIDSNRALKQAKRECDRNIKENIDPFPYSHLSPEERAIKEAEDEAKRKKFLANLTKEINEEMKKIFREELG